MQLRCCRKLRDDHTHIIVMVFTFIMVEDISDTILKKLKQVCKDQDGTSDEYRMIIELLEKTSKYTKQTRTPALKKELQQLVDQYFPYKEDGNESKY